MTQEWKPGDRAMVVIDHSSGPDGVDLRVPGGHWVPFECLHPLPLPDPLTELERRVVETAIARHIAHKEWDASRANSGGYTRDVAIARAADSSDKAHHEAVDALLVARAPKDPVAELREAYRDILAVSVSDHASTTALVRLARAITALEAIP